MSTRVPGTEPAGDELVLDPPGPIPAVSKDQVATVRLDDATAERIDAAVRTYVESLSELQAQSPEFEQKVGAISRMGNEDIRRSAEASNRFLDRPTTALKDGPLAQGSEVSGALLSLRQQIESLDPSRHLGQRRGFLSRFTVRDEVGNYFRKYQSAQSQIEAIVNSLYRGQDELLRDNAALEQEKVHLWEMKRRLEQYSYMASKLDEALESQIAQTSAHNPEKARALKEDALFYVRQKHQDLLTQLSVTVQGYLALDLIRKNNLELVKGVERATTTTVSALRTAVIAALALGNQRLVLDQISALNTTTGNIIESTSKMLRQQTAEIQSQAASSTVNLEQLQSAFNNIYATIDAIDTFKLAALDNMKTTIGALTSEIARAQVHVERARTAELAALQANSMEQELTLPATKDAA
ncbi:MAG: toxic anion resistance protein [Chloroflexota bacterium]